MSKTRKRAITLFVIATMILSILSAFIAVPVMAATITVDDSGGADHTTIQAAINAATSGDTITVAEGDYTENVLVNNSVILEGEDKATVIVTAVSALSVFRVTENDVEISGFTATGATGSNIAGIYLDGVTGCTISDNVLWGNYDGIHLSAGSDTNTFELNDVSGNKQGFQIIESDHNTFTENIANDNTKYGFLVASGSDNTFIDNEACHNTRHGFYLPDRGGPGNHRNTFLGNIANDNLEYGLRLHGGTGNT